MQPSHVTGYAYWWFGRQGISSYVAGSYVFYGMLNNSSNPGTPPQSLYNGKTIHAHTISSTVITHPSRQTLKLHILTVNTDHYSNLQLAQHALRCSV